MSFIAPYVCMQTHSTCYNGTRPMQIKGILWHSTGCNNPYIKRYVQPYVGDANYNEAIALLGKNTSNNDWNHIYREAGLNAWIGKYADGTVGVVQSMPWNYMPWGCGSAYSGGPSANNGWIQFEICEDALTDANYAQQVWDMAVEFSAWLCKMFNLDPMGVADCSGITVPVITCHQDSYKLGVGCNHTDINHWFPKLLGKDMNNARLEIQAKLATAPAAVAPQPILAVNPYKKPTTQVNSGSKGDNVKWIQWQLDLLDYKLKVDGSYGPGTTSAVKDFQKKNGITVTGNCDMNTIIALDGGTPIPSPSPQPTPAPTPTPAPQPAPAPSGTPDPYADYSKAFWDFFRTLGMPEYGVAGLIGNISMESAIRPNNLQNSYEKSLGMDDKQYTAAVDNGTYKNFVHDSAGYGLAQWTYWSRKEGLLNLAKQCKMSICDINLQLTYLTQELQSKYSGVWKALMKATSVFQASNIVLLCFEKPKDQSAANQQRRAQCCQGYYDKFKGSAITTTFPIPATSTTQTSYKVVKKK